MFYVVNKHLNDLYVVSNKAVGLGKRSKINKRRAYVYSGLQSRPIRETSLKSGKTVSYFVPQSKLDGSGPYEISIPSMDIEWLDGESGQLFRKFKVVKMSGGKEVDCDANDDYSVVNLPGNSMFKQLELYVGNGG